MNVSVGQGETIRGRGPRVLGPGLSVKGDLIAGEDLIFSGRLTGVLNAPDHAVTIAQGADVQGRVFGRVVLVEGHLRGEVTATHLIEVSESARIDGDLNAPSVSIAQGAFVTGRIDMRRADAAARVARYRLEKTGSGL